MDASALSDLQLAVMRSLWRLGSSPVSAVQAELEGDGRSLAITTVSTLLQRLEKQGWVKHEKQGRQFIYYAAVTKQAAARQAVWRVVDGFFGGSVAGVAAQLVESEKVTPEELEQMRALLDRKRKK